VSAGLFGVGVAGPRLSDSERAILRAHPPYGVILFRRNLQDVEQTRALIGEIRETGARFLLVDQEGGPVDRLSGVLAPAPSFQAAARGGAARWLGDLAGASLALLGFDVDLAPVVDRCAEGAGALVLGERCASANPHEVLQAAEDFLDGLHARGIGGCLKHFPGLGRARVDTHQAFPVLAPDLHEEALDLAPFDGLMHKARAVMISHLGGPEGLPATLSPERATRLLRDRLGFDGAAFSDDLEMGALDAFGDLPQRAAASSRAGCDLLLVCRQIERYPECVAAVEAGVPPERHAEAADRLEQYAAHLDALRRAARSAQPESPTPERLIAELGELRGSLAGA
jgi:beta-N-acetylhexosaminidase